MNKRQLLFAFVVIVFVVFGLLAVWLFGGSSDDVMPQETVAVADVTDDVIGDNESSEEVAETEEADAEPVDAVATEEVDTGETTNNDESNADGSYSIAPVSAEVFTDENPLLEDVSLGADEQQILVTASFYSASTSITVNVGDVTLIDDEGNSYSPIENGETLTPYAIGAELTAGTSLRGFVVFAVPVDAQPAMLEWCPAGNCDAVVASEVTVNE